MHTFSLPQVPASSGTPAFLSFSADTARPLLFAGSRHITVNNRTAHDLVTGFGSLGFSFVVGCAKGVDASFVRAISETDYKYSSLKACAFSRGVAKSRDLFALKVVPPKVPGKAALVKRTLWLRLWPGRPLSNFAVFQQLEMTDLCSLLVLFPSNPVGKGSRLAFRTTINQGKPVFVVGVQPQETDMFTVHKSEIFGVKGYWCIPPGCITHDEADQPTINNK